MEENINLWEKVGTGCLEKAQTLLEKETIPTGETVGMVRALVETAVSIDLLNLRWAKQSRSFAAASWSQSSTKKFRKAGLKGDKMNFWKAFCNSLRRMKDYDPITFWASMISAITGSAALLLVLVRLFLN